MSIQYDVIIVGAGAAGMMSAIEAGKRGRKVLLLDHYKKIGEKITISGGATATNIDGNILTITAQEPNVTLNIVVTVSDGNATHSIAFLLINTFKSASTCVILLSLASR